MERFEGREETAEPEVLDLRVLAPITPTEVRDRTVAWLFSSEPQSLCLVPAPSVAVQVAAAEAAPTTLFLAEAAVAVRERTWALVELPEPGVLLRHPELLEQTRPEVPEVQEQRSAVFWQEQEVRVADRDRTEQMVEQELSVGPLWEELEELEVRLEPASAA